LFVVSRREKAHRPALILLFAKKFFRVVRTHGDTNEVERPNILAPGLTIRHPPDHLLPAFTRRRGDGLALGSRIQLQQRNCSRFARDFSRRSTFL
jgi:hypothetical protein